MTFKPSMTAKPSPAAERMRTHRSRRRNGFRWASVLIHETEIKLLVQKGFLDPECVHDQDCLDNAIQAFVSNALGTTE
jgi:hypothetical protein